MTGRTEKTGQAVLQACHRPKITLIKLKHILLNK